jgi:hypothetical protein
MSMIRESKLLFPRFEILDWMIDDFGGSTSFV